MSKTTVKPKETEAKVKTTITVERIHKMDAQQSLKAFCDITINGVTVKGLRVIEGANGLFVSLPSDKGNDDKWYPSIKLQTKEDYQLMNTIVLEAYSEIVN